MIQPYYDEEGNTVYDSVDGNTYLLPSDEDEQIAVNQQEIAAEAEYQRQADFHERLNNSVELAEQRLGREVTEAEFATAMDHIDPHTLDFGAAYKEAFPNDRASDEDQRQSLMSEFMDDDQARQEQGEAEGSFE